MSDKLLGCPFCGEGKSIVQEYKNDYGMWSVGCGACGAHSGNHRNRTAVMDHWNTREGLPYKHSEAKPYKFADQADEALESIAQEKRDKHSDTKCTACSDVGGYCDYHQPKHSVPCSELGQTRGCPLCDKQPKPSGVNICTDPNCWLRPGLPVHQHNKWIDPFTIAQSKTSGENDG